MSKTQTSQSIENENIQDVEGVDNSKANHDASAPGGQSKQQPSTMSREAFLARVEQLYEQALEAGSLTVAASQLKLLAEATGLATKKDGEPGALAAQADLDEGLSDDELDRRIVTKWIKVQRHLRWKVQGSRAIRRG